MPLSPNQPHDHYVLTEIIGGGGMGTVWKARDTTLDRDVAIKVLPPEFTGNPERLARFEREAQAVAALSHFDRDRRGKQATSDAELLLAQLNGGGSAVDTAGSGDSLMLPGGYDRVSEDEVARTFGSGFAAALADLPLGDWSGPVESGYGLHLVLIRERQPGSAPALVEVREVVEREWRNARRQEATEAFYRGLRERYVVSVERPEEGDGDANPKVAEARP